MNQSRRLFFLLSVASHRLLKSVDRAAEEALDLKSIQLGALWAIRARPGCRASDVATAVGVGRSAITPLLQRLCEEGLIARRDDPTDGRAVRLSLTRAGEARLARAQPLMDRLTAAMHGDFSSEELDTVARYLHHLTTLSREALRPHDAPSTHVDQEPP